MDANTHTATFVFFLFIVMVSTIALLATYVKPKWRMYASGTLERVTEYDYTVRRRTGAMVHSTRYELHRHSTVYFRGGAVLYNIPGFLEFPECGTAISLYTNGSSWRVVPPQSVPEDGKE